MEKDLTKILSELKNIAPDAGYSARSRNLLLAEINKSALNKKVSARRFSLADIFDTVYSRKPVFALAAALAVVLVVSGSAFYAKNELNRRDFVVKAGEVNDSIQVKLNELKYLLDNKDIDYNKGVAIQIMLGEATDELKQASDEKDTAKSLEKIKSAKETLSKIDALLQNK